MEHEILHDQIAEVFGWFRESHSEHLPEELTTHPMQTSEANFAGPVWQVYHHFQNPDEWPALLICSVQLCKGHSELQQLD
jgi:hypothetical protein